MTENIHIHKAPDEMPVLLVEDEVRLRDVLSSAIREFGHPVTAVNSGEAAIRAMIANPHDIAILDLNLPGMNGLELFTAIRQRWPHAEVIILTGYGDLKAARQAIHLNVVEFLTKPASLGDLEHALQRAWRRRNDSIARELLESTLQAAQQSEMSSLLNEEPPPTDQALPLEEVERRHILAALDRCGGNRAATAAELGISLRTLYNKLAQYGGVE